MDPHRVIIVQEGEWGYQRQARGDYDSFVKSLKDRLERAERPKEGTYGHVKEKVAQVEVVFSLAEGLKRVTYPESDCTLVFVTRGMLEEADQVKKKHPHLRMVLFTGLFPEDRVIILAKDFIPDLWERAILYWR